MIPGAITLATLRYPSLNPVGFSSITAACVLTALAVLTARFNPPIARRGALLLAPPLLFVLLFLPSPFVPLLFHADMPESLAGILYAAFGFGFALANIREGDRLFRLNGSLFATLFLGGVALFTAAHLTRIVPAFLPTFLLVLLVMLAWVPLVARLNRRAVERLRGLTHACRCCGYDLRGSVGRPACPECGRAVADFLASLERPQRELTPRR